MDPGLMEVAINSNIASAAGPDCPAGEEVPGELSGRVVGFDRAQSNALFQVTNRRYERGSSTIVTTNRSR
jgi:hypothetical protein